MDVRHSLPVFADTVPQLRRMAAFGNCPALEGAG